MIDNPRMSSATLKVLAAFLSSPRDELAGVDVGNAAKVGPGTLYPILQRLEKAGWLASRWETDDPQLLKRPRRRFYRITELGAQQARIAFKDLESGFRSFSWA